MRANAEKKNNSYGQPVFSTKSKFLQRTPAVKLFVCIFVSGSSICVYNRTVSQQVLTFARLGQYGRLGNQLFQIAATIGLAEAHGYSWDFFQTIDNCAAGRLFQLQGGLNKHTPVLDYKEQNQVYYNVVLPKIQKSAVISLNGYFQDYRHFERSLRAISRYLQLPTELVQRVQGKVPEVDSQSSVALHVRRGDYLKLNALYNVLDANYYLRALSLIDERIDTVIIVSDDISWCKKNIASKIPYKTVFSPFKDELSDFVLLHLSKRTVISNSSFSWWAAFLKYVRSDKQMDDMDIHVLAPALWYNSSGKLAHLNRDSFLPPKWIRVAI